MGFDLSGLQATTKKGEYFRNNVWWWRPLWNYITEVCNDILSDEDCEMGIFNDGHEISKEKAERIATRLKEELKNGHTKEYRNTYEKARAGLNKSNKEKKVGDKTYEWGASYPFSVENVREFAEFCENSGGFAIW